MGATRKTKQNKTKQAPGPEMKDCITHSKSSKQSVNIVSLPPTPPQIPWGMQWAQIPAVPAVGLSCSQGTKAKGPWFFEQIANTKAGSNGVVVVVMLPEHQAP